MVKYAVVEWYIGKPYGTNDCLQANVIVWDYNHIKEAESHRTRLLTMPYREEFTRPSPQNLQVIQYEC